MEAGFVRVVEVGQYFMTRNAGDFKQFRSVDCREYTLPLDDPASQPKGWILVDMRIGLVLEVTTSYMYGKHGIEIRIWSMGQDNSHSWVRISHGTVKYVINSNHNNTEIFLQMYLKIKRHKQVSRYLQAGQRQKQNHKREPVDTPSIIPMNERIWIDIDPSAPSVAAYELSKKVISFLRHNQTLHREEDGAIQFYKIPSTRPSSSNTKLVR